MKKLLIAAILLAGCSSAPQRHADPKDKWINVTDSQNRVVAAFNANGGEVVYYGDPRDAFQALLGAYANLNNACQKPKEDKKGKADKKSEKK